MLDVLLENFRMVLIGGILLVVVVGRLDRLIGASLGLVFAGGVALLGSQVYARGGAVGVAAFPLPPVGFYILCAVLALMQLVSLRQGLLAREARRRRERTET